MKIKIHKKQAVISRVISSTQDKYILQNKNNFVYAKKINTSPDIYFNNLKERIKNIYHPTNIVYNDNVSDKNSPLGGMIIIGTGNIDDVKLFCKSNGFINELTMCEAVVSGNLDIVKFLHKFGCKMDYGCVHACIIHNQFEIMKYLLNIKDRPIQVNEETLFCIATSLDKSCFIDYFLKQGYKVPVFVYHNWLTYDDIDVIDNLYHIRKQYQNLNLPENIIELVFQYGAVEWLTYMIEKDIIFNVDYILKPFSSDFKVPSKTKQIDKLIKCFSICFLRGIRYESSFVLSFLSKYITKDHFDKYPIFYSILFQNNKDVTFDKYPFLAFMKDKFELDTITSSLQLVVTS